MAYMMIDNKLYEGTAKDVDKYLKYLANGKDTEMILLTFNDLGYINNFTGFTKEQAQKEIEDRIKLSKEIDAILKGDESGMERSKGLDYEDLVGMPRVKGITHD